ncbi:MAG: tRNA-dihydrouridine synthase [Microbacterium sp.]|jgi:hypothetical protein|nr:tRNA-dihydrouridine synthase [Microbacterium sp.]
MTTARTVTTVTATRTTVERMSEILHAWAVAPAAVGACCLAADRARVRPPEVVASVLMLVAMLDAAVFGVVAPVGWTALLLTAALGLAVWRRPRQRRITRAPAMMTLHTTLGMVVMAALQLGMGGHGASTGHAHGVGLAPFLLAIAVGYAGLSVAAIRRMPARLDRAQIGAMAASVVLMAVAAV